MAPIRLTLHRGKDAVDVEADTPAEGKQFLDLMGFGGSAADPKPGSLPQEPEKEVGGDVVVPDSETIAAKIMAQSGYKHSTSKLNKEYFPPNGLGSKTDSAAYNKFVRSIIEARNIIARRERIEWEKVGDGRAAYYRKGRQEELPE